VEVINEWTTRDLGMLFLGFFGKEGSKAKSDIGDWDKTQSPKTKRIRVFASVIVYIHL
jgi:hypothetical protein